MDHPYKVAEVVKSLERRVSVPEWNKSLSRKSRRIAVQSFLREELAPFRGRGETTAEFGCTNCDDRTGGRTTKETYSFGARV
jgi:hypothetical protein